MTVFYISKVLHVLFENTAESQATRQNIERKVFEIRKKNNTK